MSPEMQESRDFHAILANMVAMGASDLHIKVGAPPTMRIDGVLFGVDQPPCSPAEVDLLIQQFLPAEKQLAFAEQLECDVAIGVPGLARFRVNLCRQRGTIGASFRLVPTQIPSLEGLTLPPILGELIQQPRGLILVTGATGAGKSTTMAAMVDFLNQREMKKVVTIEDPIEYLHRDNRCLIYQREVGDDTHTFGNGLQHVLRQDPDVILIGEIRDKETLSTALTAANTGHLVMTTLHTMDAVQSIQRILSYYTPYEQDEIRRVLSSNLLAVISQRLVPRIGGQGRVAAVEIMINTPTIRDLIIDPDKTSQIREKIQEGVTQYDMQSFDQALANLVKNNVISEEEAIRNATYPNELKLLFSGIADASNRAWASVERGALDKKQAPEIWKRDTAA
ncbi:MAG: type IV pilus twitching motility protein PilT [Candidatus Eiseniibacteriota bacterium]